MTREEAIAQLKKECFTGDEVSDHLSADDILCELLKSLGCEEVVEIYDKVKKWYS